MKRIFKKNQIIISALAVMIAVAGYLNYSGRIFGEKNAKTDNELASQDLLDISMEDTSDIASLDGEVDETPGEAILTNGSVVVAEAKIAREQVRAENKAILESIINNTNVSEEQKDQAVLSLLEMTKNAELETTIETMLLSKGFTEAVVTITEKGVDVVVNSKELSDANRAQIEDIVTRQTDVNPQNIVISPLNE